MDFIGLIGSGIQKIFSNAPEIPAYNLNSVLQNMAEDSTKGNKIGLFIGRTPDQPVPSEKGWSWYTLDINLNVTETTIKKNGLVTTDHHLQMNFNDKNEMKKVAHRINKVVVDGSVVKFMDSIWDTLRQLSVPHPDSEILVQNHIYFQFEIKEKTSTFLVDKMVVYIGLDDLKKDNLAKDFEHKELSLQLTSLVRERLSPLFDQVEKKSADTFPYKELIHWQFKSYWHLKGVK